LSGKASALNTAAEPETGRVDGSEKKDNGRCGSVLGWRISIMATGMDMQLRVLIPR